MNVCIFKRVQWRWALNDFNVQGYFSRVHPRRRACSTQAWPWAVASLSARLHRDVLKDAYDRSCDRARANGGARLMAPPPAALAGRDHGVQRHIDEAARLAMGGGVIKCRPPSARAR